MNTRVTVIDYGIGNIFSICNALFKCGADVKMSSDPAAIKQAERIVLPGVGAFRDGMKGLRERGLEDAIHSFAIKGRPFLGICLGMQMMMDESEEFGIHSGLGLISGRVRAVSDVNAKGERHKIPHIGWSPIYPPDFDSDRWRNSILSDVAPGISGYFVHSYEAVTDSEKQTLAVCDYGGIKVTAVIGNGYLFGCQFHPEKSGESGLAVLKAFLHIDHKS